VIATAGSAEKAAACTTLGAHHAINYREQDFVAEVDRITGGKGVDVILDMVAGPYIARELKCMAEDGRLVIIAVQGGVDAQIDAGAVLRRRLTITGSTLRPRPIPVQGGDCRGVAQQGLAVARGRHREAGDPSGLSGLAGAQAHALMESNQHIGKLVLQW
jgi:NADPH:quinone reductase-like Zn-dependent oxidoreductase